MDVMKTIAGKSGVLVNTRREMNELQGHGALLGQAPQDGFEKATARTSGYSH